MKLTMDNTGITIHTAEELDVLLAFYVRKQDYTFSTLEDLHALNATRIPPLDHLQKVVARLHKLGLLRKETLIRGGVTKDYYTLTSKGEGLIVGAIIEER